jgi:hypothetical protein
MHSRTFADSLDVGHRKPARTRPTRGPGLLASPAFWLGGLASVGFWFLVYTLV